MLELHHTILLIVSIVISILAIILDIVVLSKDYSKFTNTRHGKTAETFIYSGSEEEEINK